MRRWTIPALFLAAAAGTGIQAFHAVLAAGHHADAPELLLAVCAVLRTIVAAAFAAFTVNRAEPHRRSRNPVAWAACGVAMFTLVAMAAPAGGTPAPLLALGDTVAVCGCLWQLASVLVLGHCFGILPEARGLVRRGPYRLVRHPVYVGEITAVTGLAIAAPFPRNVTLLAAFVAAQIVRTHLEERALTEAFPEYAGYAERTGRLLPAIGKRGESRGTSSRSRSARRLGQQSQVANPL